MRDVEVYSNGLVHCSVCALASLEREQVEAAVNVENPAGTSEGWSVADEPFASGDPNPRECNTDPDRRHWLMVC